MWCCVQSGMNVLARFLWPGEWHHCERHGLEKNGVEVQINQGKSLVTIAGAGFPRKYSYSGHLNEKILTT